MSQPGPKRRHLAVFLAARVVLDLADELLLTGDAAIERELLERSRQLTGLLEKRLRGRSTVTLNVIDLARRKRRRALARALNSTAPDPRPPRAA
jgi:hypothetical protein